VGNVTCSVEGCSRKVRATGLCGAHYEARRKERIAAGDDGRSRPCLGCGELIHRTKARGKIPAFCSEACRPRCALVDCDEPGRTRGWCVFHYSRWVEQGNPNAPLERLRHEGSTCAADGCDRPRRKQYWCSSHYGRMRATGEAGQLHHVWATDLTCVVCGLPTGTEYGRRKHCSAACQQLWIRYGGNVPAEVNCTRCGKGVRLTERGKKGYRRRVDLKLCRRCRSDLRKHGMSVEELARRDGPACGICGQEVDMNLAAPDRMRASVDHIIPRARGGTNDPRNLQLAHLQCNSVKSDRVMVT
jgi:hypothetical protein